ncbi:MAG: prepilin peptidase [Clostridiales bacterium]|nr:prepilin peptidase [Clostridiales bacterium]
MDPNVVFAIMNVILAGMFGAVIGSFTNVCIYRIPEGRTIVKGHSMCMTCSHELGALDLVPIFSWLCLGGKCRYCKTPISSRYIKIESLTALMYILMAATHLSMFPDPMDPSGSFYPFIELCALFIMINIVIVEMMIMKDTGSSMYRLSAALGIDFLVQIIGRVLTVVTTDASLKEAVATWIENILAGLLIGVVAVSIAVIFSSKPKELGKYFSDKKLRALRTSDLFAVVLCGCIGILPAAVAAIVYMIARIAIGNGKNVKYLGTILAAGAAVGYFANCLIQVL